MVASLLKLISSGIQDERLDFKRTLYPFTKVWIRAGRFTTQWGRLDFENTPTFGNTAYFRILRQGHLVTRLYLVAEMPDIYTTQEAARIAAVPPTPVFPKFGWTNSLGHALVQQLTLDIANARIETMDSRLLEILDEFNTPLEKVPIMNNLIRRKDNGFTETSFGNTPQKERVVVPLPFWFTRGDAGCALPIDAIPFDEVRVGITFRNLNGLYYTDTHVPNTSIDDGTSLWPLVGSKFYTQDPVANPTAVPILNAAGVPIQMPLTLPLGDCYIMAEYVYLDANTSNRFRLADLQIPIISHSIQQPFDTRGLPTARIPLNVANPVKDIYFMLNRVEAPSYNAHFLATRDLKGTTNTLPSITEYPKLWWPDALGLYDRAPSSFLRPGFQLSDSEPLSGYELVYEGSLIRFRTQGPALFRSVIPSYEQRKTPWLNRYYYNLPFGIQNGFTPPSAPNTEANFAKIVNKELVLQISPKRGLLGGADVNNFVVYIYLATYNILRTYGGRCSALFSS